VSNTCGHMDGSHPAVGVRDRAGFTLVELMVALALLLMFGVMATSVLTYGSALWRSARRRSHAYDVATFVFQQVEDDFAAAKTQFWGKDEDAFDTRVKLWVDHDGEFSGNWRSEGGRQRLRLVRGIPDEAASPRVRQAGDGVSNDDDDGDGDIDGDDDIDEEYYNLKDDDEDGRTDEDLRPLEGMCEVAYLLGLGDADRRTLYRAVLSPIGDRSGGFGDAWTSLFTKVLQGPVWKDILDDQGRIDRRSVPLARDVLHFEVRLWTQHTTTWDPAVPYSRPQRSYVAEECGPVFTWDSDRLRPGKPSFLMDPGQPGFPRNTLDADNDGVPNEDDEDYILDNVFPRCALVVLVIDPSQEYPLARAPRIGADASAAESQIRVEGPLPAYNTSWPYLHVGNEWVYFERVEAGNQYTLFHVAPNGRGARGTTAGPHAAGDVVRFGYTFARAFHNPAEREYEGQ
jgi:prepilin-type N-terminal cleavage/methylation domain-containing protein